MPINTNVSNLPDAPNRSGSPSTFASDTDAFLAALPALQSEINAYAAAANSTGDQISDYLSAAEQGAVTGLDVARWDSETTYARFDPVIGSDGNTYRSLVDNNLSNDPTTDGGDNWLNLSEVSLAPILKPDLLSPTDGETDVGETPTLDAGNYYSLYGRPHTFSRFQVSDDDQFSNIVYDSGEIAATQTHTVPSGNLQEGEVTYYWRAYYVDDAGTESEYSDTQSFTTQNSFGLAATGGTVTDITDGGVNYRVHTFTSSGTFEVTGEGGDVEYLVVAGGGSGGARIGAGGGAGGYRSSVAGENSGGNSGAESPLSISSGSYPVTVGAGGAPADAEYKRGFNGGSSSFNTITSIGGGGGGGNSLGLSGEGSGSDGGSGGGGGSSSNQGYSSGAATNLQGSDGGDGGSNSGGGGGGASQVGQNASGSTAGDGGNGLTSSIGGTSVTRGGGGGGSSNGESSGGAGGSGGGGNGGNQDENTRDSSNGETNTGGGGGGGNYKPNAPFSSAGGSGIVIIRYQI